MKSQDARASLAKEETKNQTPEGLQYSCAAITVGVKVLASLFYSSRGVMRHTERRPLISRLSLLRLTSLSTMVGPLLD